MIPLFDAHCDTPSYLYETGGTFAQSAGQVGPAGCHSFSPHARFFAYWKYPFAALHSLFAAEIMRCGDVLSLCRTGAEARAAARRGQTAVFLSIEGAGVIDCDAGRLLEAMAAGVRMISLTWNDENALSGGAADPEKGLTSKGRAFVRTLVARPILIDVSHLSDRGFWDLAELLGDRPFVASHSNARHCLLHPRNLTDEQIRRIFASNGFVGINLHSPFLTSGRRAVWDDVWRHVEHMLSLGGENHIGLGCDFDGGIDPPEDCDTLADLFGLYDFLLRKNLTEAQVVSIFYDSLMEVVDRVCGL